MEMMAYIFGLFGLFLLGGVCFMFFGCLLVESDKVKAASLLAREFDNDQ